MSQNADPVLHTPLPKNVEGHNAEYELGLLLSRFHREGFEFWFDLNYLPNVPDIDLMVYSKKVGLFVCEIKGHSIQQIGKYTAKEFIRSDGQVVSHPVTQVRRNSQKLKDFHARMLKQDGSDETVPFFQTTVVWPRITRAQWEERFASRPILTQSKSFVFQDDLLNARTFNEKLSEIRNKPLLGIYPPTNPPREKHGVKSLADYIKSAESDHQRSIKAKSDKPIDIAYLEKELNKYPFGETHIVQMSGAAGTGKTTFMIQLGMQHARVGGSVLYLCYNKALAAEVQAQVQLLRSQDTMLGHIDVYDQFALYENIAPEVSYMEHEATAEDVILCLKRIPQHEIVKYDTILIDEGQDINGDAIAVAEYLAVSDASWFVSISKGQELFGFDQDREFPCAEIQRILQGAKRPARNRLFRGSEIPFLASYAFHEYFPNIERVKKFISEKVLSRKFQVGEEERQKELPAQAKHMSVSYLPSSPEAFKSGVRSAVLETLQEVREYDGDGSLMVIVFGDKSPAYPIVRATLREAKKAIHDLTIEKNRRNVAAPGSVRIVKAMGSRGLSATHVLVFDFDFIQQWCADKAERPPAMNLSYVVLTRAAHSTKVFVDTENINENTEFLASVISEMRLAKLTGGKS
ncbi:MAG: hypothetical protein EBS36_06365 [Actinobacteria bacterium]|nr:hypothetical protein [Actinomycetota bacterium]NBY15798.1 hypothetical protein [Actinomycetota bacterium]